MRINVKQDEAGYYSLSYDDGREIGCIKPAVSGKMLCCEHQDGSIGFAVDGLPSNPTMIFVVKAGTKAEIHVDVDKHHRIKAFEVDNTFEWHMFREVLAFGLECIEYHK